MSNVYKNEVNKIKQEMLQTKPVEEVTKFEKSLYFEANRLADRLDNVVHQLARELANAKWERLASETNKEYEEWDAKFHQIYETAYLISLNTQVVKAMEVEYEDLVKTWGNPQMKVR